MRIVPVVLLLSIAAHAQYRSKWHTEHLAERERQVSKFSVECQNAAHALWELDAQMTAASASRESWVAWEKREARAQDEVMAACPRYSWAIMGLDADRLTPKP